MRILITIQHPAHVHFFRNAITDLQSQGHKIRVLVRQNDIAVDLLELYDIDHTVVAGPADGLFGIARVQPKYEWSILKETRAFSPDTLAAIAEPGVAHASTISDARSVVFTDTEHVPLQEKLVFPFADCICTPDCYEDDLGRSHETYAGYHELAYLHPDRFEPDRAVLDEADLDQDEQFALVRLVSWDAVHDIGDSGFDSIGDVVTGLEETGTTVRITAEQDLPSEVEHCQVKIDPHKIHHLMSYASLYLGESATMAAESAVLGTPAVFVSSSRRSYTNEMENEYGLVFNYSGPNRHQQGVERALEILNGDSTARWKQSRQRLLEEKIDTTAVISDQLTTKQ